MGLRSRRGVLPGPSRVRLGAVQVALVENKGVRQNGHLRNYTQIQWWCGFVPRSKGEIRPELATDRARPPTVSQGRDSPVPCACPRATAWSPLTLAPTSSTSAMTLESWPQPDPGAEVGRSQPGGSPRSLKGGWDLRAFSLAGAEVVNLRRIIVIGVFNGDVQFGTNEVVPGTETRWGTSQEMPDVQRRAQQEI